VLQDASGTASAHLQSTEEQVLAAVRNNVKKGIQWCNDYPLFAYGGAVAALFLFPAPRAFLFKSVFGAFQSQVRSLSVLVLVRVFMIKRRGMKQCFLQESAFRAATERFAVLSETSQNLAKQKAQAVESGQAALEALAAAHAKAADASRQLASIEAQLQRTSTSFDGKTFPAHLRVHMCSLHRLISLCFLSQ
jgi:hypothetical protein